MYGEFSDKIYCNTLEWDINCQISDQPSYSDCDCYIGTPLPSYMPSLSPTGAPTQTSLTDIEIYIYYDDQIELRSCFVLFCFVV